MILAHYRGDTVERDRLYNAAPKETWRVSHCFGLSLELMQLAFDVQARLLEWIGWHAMLEVMTLQDDVADLYAGKLGGLEERGDERDAVQRMQAFRFLEDLEVMEVVCTDLGIDARELRSGLLGCQLIYLYKPIMEAMAFRPEEAREF